MIIKVECYAGYRSEQEPVAFYLGERRLSVREIVDRWIEPRKRWYKCLADDAKLYILRHDEHTTEWELVSFTHAQWSG